MRTRMGAREKPDFAATRRLSHGIAGARSNFADRPSLSGPTLSRGICSANLRSGRQKHCPPHAEQQALRRRLSESVVCGAWPSGVRRQTTSATTLQAYPAHPIPGGGQLLRPNVPLQGRTAPKQRPPAHQKTGQSQEGVRRSSPVWQSEASSTYSASLSREHPKNSHNRSRLSVTVL